MRLLVRSRRGNLVLGFLGFIYAVSATAVLAWFVIDMWRADGAIDRLLQLALIIAGACGIWFVVTAMENLGLRHHRQWHLNR